MEKPQYLFKTIMPKKARNLLTKRKNARDAFNRNRAAERRGQHHESDDDDEQEQFYDAVPFQIHQSTQAAPLVQDQNIQLDPFELGVFNNVGTQSSHCQADKNIQLDPFELGVFSNAGTQTTSHCQVDQHVLSSLETLNVSLRASLCPVWTTSCTKEQLQIIMIENVSGSLTVKRGLMFTATDFCITIHGRQLLNSHALICSLQQQKEDELERRKINDISGTNLIFNCEQIKDVVEKVQNMKVCDGITNYTELWSQGVFSLRGSVDNVYSAAPVYRTKACHLLLSRGEKDTCLACRTEQTNMVREQNKREKRALLVKDSSSRNIKYMQRHELEAALRDARQEDSKHRRQIKSLRNRIDSLIEKEGTQVSRGWSDEFMNVNKKNFDKMTDLQKMFWDQQLKAASLKNKSSMKWHPMMIRLAINFETHSNPEKIRATECIFLPSKRTLFDYTHYITAQDGCQKEILDDFKQQLDENCKEDHEMFCSLMFDEMHVRSNLVYSKSRQELVGYANLDSLEQEFRNLEAEWTGIPTKPPPLAQKVLVFMIRNITPNKEKSQMKGVVAIYSVASSMSAASLFTRLWDVIYCLEGANIPIISIVCDGASTNRSCLKMHPRYKRSIMEIDFDDDDDDVYEDENDVVFCTTNLASSDLRPLYFIIDPPHLLKTIRNAFANSFSHKKSRHLWNQELISWKLITEYYDRIKTSKLRKSTITSAHVRLTSFSVMKVSYAAQVMSNTLSKAIREEGDKAKEEKKEYPPYQAATTFMKKTNDLFDSMNGHNITSGSRYRNDNLKPYSSKSDPRFKEVMLNYLQYLEDWKQNVMTRQGNYSKEQRAKMMLPHQTMSALRITIFGMKGAIKYLLNKGATEICARRFCQDPLEQAFSIFRAKGGSNNSLDVQQVQQARVKQHAQGQTGFATASKKGNTEVEERKIEIDNTPLPKRKRK
ncbi:Transposable element P transposase [Frankliniella fusca]|uniref:Transposable element P transposase n=1 Tax=Frankliniella fusca TaxID=407009 RepID=A0AAE1H1M4_9NEOP|nr:Transposable element P transposase [Frankliniella fusca]